MAVDSPLSGSEYLVIRFDPRDASMAVLDNMGYSARNRADALADAQAATGEAAERGEPVQHVVIRLAVEARFGPED